MIARLWARWPVPSAPQLGQALIAAYAAPSRHYHDLRHLSEVLDRLDELTSTAGPAPDSTVLRLAAWFHDAVYQGGPDDEELSACWAETGLGAAGLETARVAEVARLVRLTAGHRPAADDRAGLMLCDADLAILGAEPDRYAEYAADVRREYAHVGELEYAAGRCAVLRTLLRAPALYGTELGRRRWEARARSNIQAEIDRHRPIRGGDRAD